MTTRILVVDNYDSFVFNLVQYLYQLGAECEVVRNDAIGVERADDEFAGVLLSPGPGAPAGAGVSRAMVEHCATRGVPLFGVCLGMQTLAEVFGGEVSRAPELLHGKTSEVFHESDGVFHGLPSPFTATRYHSLGVPAASVPAELRVTARTAQGLVMGLRHRELPVEGVQFHPESVLTEWGHLMLANWLAECGDADAVARSTGLAGVSGTVGTGPVRT